MSLQRTVKDEIRLKGVGLHSGKEANLTIKPGRPNQGIVFVRTDVSGALPITAHFKNVTSTQLATTLGRNPVSVSTVEHLMSALAGAQIDNAIIEVDGPEVPILDGSAAPFYSAIEATGVATQAQKRPVLALRRKIELKLNEKWAVAEPASSLEIHGSIDWDHPAIGYQEFHYVSGKTRFDELARARTFGFIQDVEALKRMGLARGGSLENAVVLDEGRVLNPEGLRYSDEFVRHKVLDALGDLKLAGIELRAYVRLHRAGHDLHSQLLNAIFQDPDNFEIIDASVREELRPARVRPMLAASLVASVT